MNVLLAEAGVPYDLIYDEGEINAEFETADVALVIGANDVVNPVARTDKSSPIYGMPILNADKAKNVIVIKRGQGAGFSGIENALFYLDHTRMLYGDGQAKAAELVQADQAALAALRRSIARSRATRARALTAIGASRAACARPRAIHAPRPAMALAVSGGCSREHRWARRASLAATGD